MKVGLFLGSFNPIHTGHLIIANHFVEFTGLKQVWFVVSPKNPLKNSRVLLDAELRLRMVKAAIAANKHFKVCDAEFHLPKPSYTIDTLRHLKTEYPQHTFIIIMGSDSYADIIHWKDYKTILSAYPIYIYKRRDYPVRNPLLGKAREFNFPFIDISATYIRRLIKKGKSVQFLVPEKALAILRQHQSIRHRVKKNVESR